MLTTVLIIGSLILFVVICICVDAVSSLNE